MSAPATPTRLTYDPRTRTWEKVPAPRVFVRKPWVEPNLRGGGRPAQARITAAEFASPSGIASFMLSFVLVLSLALLLAG